VSGRRGATFGVEAQFEASARLSLFEEYLGTLIWVRAGIRRALEELLRGCAKKTPLRATLASVKPGGGYLDPFRV
jgi:hypothetical protein